MRRLLWLAALFCSTGIAAPFFKQEIPLMTGQFVINGPALCHTAKQTRHYLDKGNAYDPAVIHAGRVLPISLVRVKKTLDFICQHQHQLNNPLFIKKHFDFIRWYPDLTQAKSLAAHKTLLKNLPDQRILMTKYFVHLAAANQQSSAKTPFALYGLPQDEAHLSLEQANKNPKLTRFQFGKQAILSGALNNKQLTELAFVNREDLEMSLLQGSVVADFGPKLGKKTFNVHRCNNIAYDRSKSPYEQQRYWFFKTVDGIKGYGKDADHKITVNPEATFAADLEQFGLGKLLLIQYPNKQGTTVTRAGIMADTGGAFAQNLYQVDYLAGSYHGRAEFAKATAYLPDYVDAYFMVLKEP